MTTTGGTAIGVEWDHLSEYTQIAYLQRKYEVSAADRPDEALWQAYAGKSATVQKAAETALKAMLAMEEQIEAGQRIGAAMIHVAQQFGLSRPTVERMRAKIRDASRANWLPLLAGNYEKCGRPRIEISEEAWTYFLSILKEGGKRLPLTVAYRKTEQAAAVCDWAWPSYAAIRNRWEELPAGEKAIIKSGPLALDKTIPPMTRSVAHLQAMQIVNLDGRQTDFFVRWHDGTCGRAIVIAIQDVYSRMILGWRFSKTEDADTTKAVILDVIDRYGVFDELKTDNGRAFASKKISGGATYRFRGKKPADGEDEILGILPLLGCKVGFAKPRRGQSKPIERGFRDVAEGIDALPEFKGAHCGHRPDAKPEDFTGKPIDIDVAKAIYDRELREHNERVGRRTEMGRGKLSLATVFHESFRQRIPRRLTTGQRRYFLYDMVQLKPNRDTGALTSKGFTWWSAEHQDVLLQHRHGKVTAMFDPNDRSKPVTVLDREGNLLIDALPCLKRGQFDSTEDARQHERGKAQIKQGHKQSLKGRKLMTAAQLAAMQKRVDAEKPVPASPSADSNVTGAVFGAPPPKPKAKPGKVTPVRTGLSGDDMNSALNRGLDILQNMKRAG
ncbi:transposase domain-containing protein [Acetobacter senegalensis]|uniref:transposase domain-containing protein n=1 Tax=Acetobacter senegalensis TaxID=446692 RepID=UPI00264A6908|nr:transposase domain-containing protein [Acetobacter senegalensis]MDN7351890.1 transposase domain-containing protein [Acetobacter senegalensis]